MQAGGNTPKCYQCLSLGCGAFASFSRSLFILKLPTMNVIIFHIRKAELHQARAGEACSNAQM